LRALLVVMVTAAEIAMVSEPGELGIPDQGEQPYHPLPPFAIAQPRSRGVVVSMGSL